VFKKIVIANRGEIAVRVIRAARELGIATVAVYSEADRDSLHVALADDAVCIGPAASARSYLNAEALLSAAKLSGADALHPGYGFLAENADFAQRCCDCGLTFIGPSPAAIRELGNKSAAKDLARRAGVPIVPGSRGTVARNFLGEASALGFPLMIKAAAGGGGKGLRLVRDPGELDAQVELARNEARTAFNDDSVYIEKFIEKPRHVEIQIAADSRGRVAAFPERDCTVQRRHQKLIEESPSPAVSEGQRRAMQSAAASLARACGYSNVGTVEFLLSPDGKFYFIEVNTRLQVEHPVTECITGLDLVTTQIRLAAGEPLPFTADRAGEISGHAIEHRINAEDPDRDFRPGPGRITGLRLPGGPGVRLDTHVYAGYTVPVYYDSLLSKLIVHGPDRRTALARSWHALGEMRVEGVPTTVEFHRRVLKHPLFRRGDFDTCLADSLQEKNGKDKTE
jgi:acetyl-CoA carboxylase biotin carboxylase subunit